MNPPAMDDRKQSSPDTSSLPSQDVAADDLAQRVYDKLSSKHRGQISLELVRNVASQLDLRAHDHTAATRLQIRRLRFSGMKRIKDKPEAPIQYDQQFFPGVNVLLILDNDVGKSSVLKTIKFGLTGDDSDYDADVRSWIKNVWLHFSLDLSTYTVHIAVGENSLTGYIASGEMDGPAADAAALPGIIDVFNTRDETSNALEAFFLKRLRLEKFSWTQTLGNQTSPVTASWRTFFQGLVIPDSSDGYLLLDDKHAYGNQDGLLISTLLGLHLIQPMNQLQVGSKVTQQQANLSKADLEQAKLDAEQLEQGMTTARSELNRIRRARQERRAAYDESDPTDRIIQATAELAVHSKQASEQEGRRDQHTTNIQLLKASARNVREAITLRLHFSGLNVSMCPNCDHDVDESSIEREHHDHLCRLCGKPADSASGTETEQMEIQAEELELQAEKEIELRGQAAKEMERAQQHGRRLEQEITILRDRVSKGMDYVQPTPEEEEATADVQQRLGALMAKHSHLEERITEYLSQTSTTDLRVVVQEKMRAVLRSDAEELNRAVLTQLSTFTEEMARKIGTESISDVTCSPLGKLTLQKHGVKVGFGTIHNPGERLRVKLAFFLSMMRLGRNSSGSRHPGLLMVDQPGSAEMVDEDFKALADILAEINRDYNDEVQIICFTARPQFAYATAPHKVFGPQAGKDAF